MPSLSSNPMWVQSACSGYPHMVLHPKMPGVRFKSVMPHPVDVNSIFLEHYEGMYTLALITDLQWLGNSSLNAAAIPVDKALLEFKVEQAEVEKNVITNGVDLLLAGGDDRARFRIHGYSALKDHPLFNLVNLGTKGHHSSIQVPVEQWGMRVLLLGTK